MWYLVLGGALIEIGFDRLDADLAVWVRVVEGRIQFVVGYVDDMLNIGLRGDVDEVKPFLATKFKLKDMSPVSIFVEFAIVRDRDKREIYINQAHYLRKLFLWESLKSIAV